MKYIDNPYAKEFQSEFSHIFEIEGEKFGLLNDIFSGTDKVEADEFTINLHESYKKIKNGKVFYKVQDSEKVKINIDFEKRMDLGERVLSNAIVRLLLKKTFNIESDFYIFEDNKIIISQTDIAFSTLEKLEELANQIVRSNISTKFSENFLSLTGLGKIYFEGPLLKRTGELALIKILPPEKIENKIVLNILSGKRAFDDYKNKSKIFDNMIKTFNVDSEDQLFKKLKVLKASKQSLVAQKKKMEMELGYEAVKDFKNIATNFNGINYIYKILNNVNFKELKLISSKIMDEANYVQIYGIPNGNMGQVLIYRSRNLNIDLKGILDRDFSNLNGSGNMLSIKLNCSINELSNVMEKFLLKIKNSLEKGDKNV